MNIHKLLKRQLEKNNLSTEIKPESNEDWIKFLTHVNQVYTEADQERYLQERSMQISSREVMSLNERLEKAQHIAGLGYWSYDEQTNRTIWSKELYNLFHFDKTHTPPVLYEFLEWIHEADRYELKKKFQKAITEKINFEEIIRIKIDNEYVWFQIIAQSSQEDSLVSGIFMNIHDIKVAEEEINDLNQRLILTARQAGMSEVAATILHNVGNTLNTLNVSLDILKNNICYRYIDNLIKINDMILMHQQNLSDFLENDPKGVLIPNYMSTIKKVFPEEESKMQNELSSLEINIKHIKEIVASQNLISGLPNTIHEKIYLPELLDQVLNMVMIPIADKKIVLEKEFEACPPIENDKSKLLQILINLIQNARDSVLENESVEVKKIILKINLLKENYISIIVSDNGMGIEKENLARIFNFGFTTKKEGHGFGLHSAALSAKQMGGELMPQSEGIGKGATFILTLPITESD